MNQGQARTPWVLCARGRVVPLTTGEHVIGRAGSDIDFSDDPKLSRRHARLVVSADAVEVEDLGSTNGTWVDSYLVQHRLRVTRSSILRLGGVEASLAPSGDLPPQARHRTTVDERPNRSERDPETTQRNAGLEFVEHAVEQFLETGNPEHARLALDPVLATIELATRELDEGALESASLLALRLALELRDASYVDAAVRMHCAHAAEMSDSCLERLSRCTMAGFEPDPRNVEAYLAVLGEDLDETTARARQKRLETALAAPSVTVPAPAPVPSRHS